MILTRSTRLTQPTGPVELDYTNPLLSRHSFLWSAAHDVRKSLIGSQRIATVVGGYAPSTEGKSWKAASGKPVAFPLGEHFISTSDGAGTGDFTLWVIANPESSATLRDMVGQSFTASGPNSGFILIRANAAAGSVTSYCGSGTSAGTFDSVVASGQANGRVRLFLARRLGTELSLWVDGAKVASSSYTIRNILGAQTQTAVSVGCNPYSTGATSIHSNVMAGGANRALSDDEIESLSANPWQLFRPVQRRVYFDMGAGGGGTTHTVTADPVEQATTTTRPGLTQTHVTTAMAVAQGATVSRPAITQTHVVTARSVAQGSTVNAPDVEVGSITVVTARPVVQSSTVNAPSIVQTHIVTARPAAQGSTVTRPGLNQAHTVTARAVTQGSVVNAPSVDVGSTPATFVTARPVAQGSTVNAPGIRQTHVTSARAVVQGSTISAPGLVQAHVVTARAVVQASTVRVAGIAPPFVRSIYWASVPAERFKAAVPSEKFSSAVPGGNQ